MSEPIRLGIAGLGTVGAGVAKILENTGETIAARSGRPVMITAVSARTRNKDRGVDLSAFAWEDDPVALAQRDDVDVFVELILWAFFTKVHDHYRNALHFDSEKSPTLRLWRIGEGGCSRTSALWGGSDRGGRL